MRVKTENLTKRFGDFTAVDHFSLTFEDGKLAALLGPSGCGKSTILNMLSGILPVTEGKIYFDEDDVTNMPPQDRGVGLVFQNYALYPHMSVLENIAFPLEIQKVPKAQRRERAMEMAALVHVEKLVDRKPSALSGGQQQRVAIARALIKSPRLLLLDEPLSNLDARLRLEMREEIRRIQVQTGVTTIFVTHDQEEAMSICDRIVLMKDGVLQQEDDPQTLYDSPANTFVANFLGNPPINNLYGFIKDGAFVTRDGAVTVRYRNFPQNLPEGRRVILGVRAEAAIVSNNDSYDFRSVIKRRYTMGKEELAFLDLGDQEMRVYLSTEHETVPGSEDSFHLRSKGVFLFDEETGVRL